MYKDIMHYTLVEGTTKEKYLEVVGPIVKEHFTTFEGFISWEVNESENGIMIDIATWESRENAKNAESKMMQIPNAMDWYSMIDANSGTHAAHKATQLDLFN